MARKKAGKPSSKRETKSALQRLEQELKDSPARLTAEVAKEIKNLKTKEAKLKASSIKLKAKVKELASRYLNAEKNKKTPSGKKKFAALKKQHDLQLKKSNGLEKELKAQSNAVATATNKHAKYSALKKHISQFEKDWAKKLKAKQTETKKPNKKPAAKKQASYEKPVQDDKTSPATTYKGFDEEVRVEEAVETTS